VHGYVLRPFVADTADQLAETRLGVLQRPVGDLRRACATGRFRPGPLG
jgi:hypothetical protein